MSTAAAAAAAATKVGRDVSRGNLLISGAKSIAFNPELLVGHGWNSRVVYIANCVRIYGYLMTEATSLFLQLLVVLFQMVVVWQKKKKKKKREMLVVD